MKIALGLEYDGAAFCGWQTQADGCGVQDALENAAAEFAGEKPRIHCAGRTDAGAHAASQIVHLKVAVVRQPSSWVRAMNALLPPAAGCLWAKIVGEDFHARYSAQARRYQYILLNRPERPALLQAKVGWHHAPLDVGFMREAAAHLIGEHDFSAFRAAACQAKSPVRNLISLDIRRRGEFIVFEFCANAFLHRMVRNIVGALIYIGRGKQPPQWSADLLAAKRREQSAPTISAAGLYFIGADYPPQHKLPPTIREAPLPRVADG
jgi:tRNA pseudouridine38-40 synthase